MYKGMSARLDAERERAGKYELQLKYMSPVNRIREKKNYLMTLEERLEELMKRSLREKRHRLDIYIEKMKGLSPLQKLQSGFSYVMDEDGRNIRSVKNAKIGQELKIQMSDGRLSATVTGTLEEQYDD